MPKAGGHPSPTPVDPRRNAGLNELRLNTICLIIRVTSNKRCCNHVGRAEQKREKLHRCLRCRRGNRDPITGPTGCRRVRLHKRKTQKLIEPFSDLSRPQPKFTLVAAQSAVDKGGVGGLDARRDLLRQNTLLKFTISIKKFEPSLVFVTTLLFFLCEEPLSQDTRREQRI